MKKDIKLTVRMTPASELVQITTLGDEVVPGLAVHKYFRGMDGKGIAILSEQSEWQITHVHSGLKIGNYPFLTKKKAVETAKVLGGLCDWDQDGNQLLEIVNGDVYRTKIRPVLVEAEII